MANNTRESDDDTTIDVDTVRRFAECLSALGAAYATIADWLITHGVRQIPGGGTPTAKKGLRFIGNYTSTVLTAYQEALLTGQIPAAPPEVISKAYGTLATAKNLGTDTRKKKK